MRFSFFKLLSGLLLKLNVHLFRDMSCFEVHYQQGLCGNHRNLAIVAITPLYSALLVAPLLPPPPPAIITSSTTFSSISPNSYYPSRLSYFQFSSLYYPSYHHINQFSFFSFSGTHYTYTFTLCSSQEDYYIYLV